MRNIKCLKAFTLIELLVVIAIIAILAAILFPVFAQAREKARQATCASNLKQIALGVIQYEQDYDEDYPTQGLSSGNDNYDYGQTAVTIVQPYIKSYDVFTCPDDPQAAPPTNSSGYVGPKLSYVFNGAMGYDTNGWGEDGLINPGWGWLGTGTDTPVSDASVNFPSSTILVTEAWQYPAVDGTQSYIGAFDAFHDVADGADGNDDGIIPGQTPGNQCTADTNPNDIILNHSHAGRTNFAFADGHVKALFPLQTVNVNNKYGTCRGYVSGSYNNNFFYMWSANRPTEDGLTTD
jgi:prepilin-type N-terminal cleavage/methylation domain-containing protein/prepilin-type processing-associated H-X9-DG protein